MKNEFWMVTVTHHDGIGLGMTRIVLGCEGPAKTLFDAVYTRPKLDIASGQLLGAASLNVRLVTLRQIEEPPYRTPFEKERAEKILDAVFPDKGTFTLLQGEGRS